MSERIKETLLASSAALLGIFLLPLLLIRGPVRAAEVPTAPPMDGEAAEDSPLPKPPENIAGDGARRLRVLEGDTVREMTLAEYLTGVTAAEMPASFEPEALKAQAVAARTYTLYQLASGGRHGDTADICTDAACCQAYIDITAARENWGGSGEMYEQKIRQAVAETDGEVILYGGVPILAVFHASSAGLTRRAGQVWQNDLPYLQAVDSPETAESIPNYYSRAELSTAEMKKKLLAAVPGANLSGGASGWLKNAVRDEAGTVETVEVGGVTVRGGTVRSALGLRSACFEWEVGDGGFVFYVTGHGHGVGLSQYGANAMAEAGADYRTILTHYYTGVTVEPYSS